MSLTFFEAPGGNTTIIFGVHGAVFLVLGTIWFHLLGEPALAGWAGAASPLKLEEERNRFRGSE